MTSTDTNHDDGSFVEYGDGWKGPANDYRVEQPPTPAAPPPAAYELWVALENALRLKFAATAAGLREEITACEQERTLAVDVDAAAATIERRDRARRRLDAISTVRRNALDPVLSAAHEAGRRDDRIRSVGARLKAARSALAAAKSDDDRAAAKRLIDALQPRLAELQAEELADTERARAAMETAASGPESATA